MIKFIATSLLALACGAVFAAVDVNKASQAELESVRGIGPSLSAKILEARKTGPFTDWNDLQFRVRGVGPGNAVKLSAEGLTVNGAAYTPATQDKSLKASATKPTSVARATAESAQKAAAAN